MVRARHGLAVGLAAALSVQPRAAAAVGAEPVPSAREAAETLDPERERRIEIATEAYREGEAHLAAHRHREAAAAFERSYAAIPDPATLYNIGLCHERAGQTIAAISAFERYLAEASTASPEERAALEETLRGLRGKTAEIELVVDPEVELRGIVVDGREVAAAAFPLRVLPGRIELELHGAEPGQTRQRTVELHAGQHFTWSVGPFPPPVAEPRRSPAVAEPRGPAEPTPRVRRLRIAFGAAATAAGVAAGAVAVLGGLTLSAKRRYEEALCEDPCPCPEGNCYPTDEEHRFERLQQATNAMIGVASVLGVTAVVLGVLAFRKPRARGPARAGLRLVGPATFAWAF